jgi:hypothetical protein
MFNALQHLRLIQNGAHITDLYWKFFPEEFAKDPPDYSDGWKLMGFYDRFARLVDARLFPVYEFSDSDLAYEEPNLSKGIEEFFKWCDSSNKVERVKRLLRGAQVSEKEEQERIRVRVARRSRPLVETLGGLV